ncbi:MAG: hypothetical protein PHR56_00640 [Dehalococcoidales bacterium]|nr:hypothetical protein [Dehalococcoidales bacterium]
MENDARIQTLEEEFKLIKGELKQTLTSVREYLMETGLPDSEYTTILAAMAGGAESQKIEMKGDFAMPKKPEPEEEEEIVEELEETQDNESNDSQAEDSEDSGDDVEESEEELGESGASDDADESDGSPEAEALEQAEAAGEEMLAENGGELSQGEQMAQGLMEPQTAYARMGRVIAQDTPRVNLLANLIRWVAAARREIGVEQLATFLEVYGICGHLTPELKEVIIRLSDVAQPQSEEAGAADVWSRLLLELHGILTGADAPAHAMKPIWNDGKAAVPAVKEKVEEPKDEPMQLKLVLKDSKGNDREFNLNLTPAAETKKPPAKRK